MKDPNPLVYTCLPHSAAQHTIPAHTSTPYNTVHRAGLRSHLKSMCVYSASPGGRTLPRYSHL